MRDLVSDTQEYDAEFKQSAQEKSFFISQEERNQLKTKFSENNKNEKEEISRFSYFLLQICEFIGQKFQYIHDFFNAQTFNNLNTFKISEWNSKFKQERFLFYEQIEIAQLESFQIDKIENFEKIFAYANSQNGHSALNYLHDFLENNQFFSIYVDDYFHPKFKQLCQESSDLLDQNEQQLTASIQLILEQKNQQSSTYLLNKQINDNFQPNDKKFYIFGISLQEYVVFKSQIIQVINSLLGDEYFQLSEDIYTVANSLKNLSWTEKDDQQIFFKTFWNSVVMIIEQLSRIQNLVKGQGMDFSNFNKENVGTFLFSWDNVQRLFYLIKENSERMMNLFIQDQFEQFNNSVFPPVEKDEEQEYIENYLTEISIGKQQQKPDLKAIISGLDEMDIQNIKVSQVQVDFFAQKGDLKEKLIAEKNQEIWSSEDQEKANAIVNIYFPLISFMLDYFHKVLPKQFSTYKKQIFEQMNQYCTKEKMNEDFFNFWVRQEKDYIDESLNQANLFIDILEKIVI
ncbi:hypothetical protein PPERSA_05934 [Pseudocohnilembus persalinus]|uniref:Uncharacterized protein n=1 Tax=Pseudocohnilembus persalinus TaxID=266149 RepID=A0A0V0R461_PSEPJ|nr:hypothetical protein PPERSA_05934 [Pseudocohnilembus persalinus]|eukprot:KRX09265.1 hypothetical protein PPERSA_05934 [Pseudocohnilembus persalinus]